MLKKLFVFLNLIPLIFAVCPQGSVEWNSKCFYFQTNETEFATAEIECKSISGNLVSVHDGFTNALLTGEATNYFSKSTEDDFWIGGNLLMNTKKWSWIDNSPFDFSEWNKGEPQNITGSECVSVSISTGTWSSQDCFKKKPYVCDVTPKPTVPPFVKCPWGWAYFEPTGSCYGVNYTVHVGKLSWTSAEQYCERYGAHLTSVHSYEELSFLDSYDGYAWGGGTWIGLYTNDGGNSWKNSDNSTADYFDWAPNQKPSPYTCAGIGNNGMYMLDCNTTLLFLCKKKVN